MRSALASVLRAACVCAAVLAGSAGTAHAGQAVPMAADPALELRVMAVAEELRCLVCQNETIAASQADLARDLRGQIREQLQRGQSPQQVLDFMVARYGEFVLYRPPLRAGTVLLWSGPFALMAFALVWLAGRVRRRTPAVPVPLTEDERRRVQQLLEGKEFR